MTKIKLKSANAASALHLEVIGWGRALMCVHLGYLFIIDPDMFSTMPMLKTLDAVMSQPTWGVVCIACGALRIAGLLINRAVPSPGRWRHANTFAAGVTCFVWLQLTLSYMAAPIESPGLAILPYLLILDVYCVFVAAGAETKHVARVSDGGGIRRHRIASVGTIRR